MNKRIYLNLAIPIFVQIVLMFIQKISSPGTYSCILGWTIWIILPSILVIVNLFLFFYKIETSFLKCSIFMFLGLLLGEVLGYVIWGTLNRCLFHPDGETIDISKELIIYYAYFVTIFFLIVKGSQFIAQKSRKIEHNSRR